MDEFLVYKIIVVSFIMPLLLSAGFAFFIWRYQKQKNKYEIDRRDQTLKQQALVIEKQEAIERERNRIAGEMHDDLGSGLTTIKYLSEHAMKSSVSDNESKKIKRISEHANQLVSNMSEIIWAMNSRYDTASDLSGYVRRYASEFVQEYDKELKFTTEGLALDTELSGEKRRAIFLVVKEILHNFVKYANVSTVTITIKNDNQTLSLEILENDAKGFDPELCKEKGNGLFNMKKRITSIGGNLDQRQTDRGMLSVISYPIG